MSKKCFRKNRANIINLRFGACTTRTIKPEEIPYWDERLLSGLKKLKEQVTDPRCNPWYYRVEDIAARISELESGRERT